MEKAGPIRFTDDFFATKGGKIRKALAE